ncbi:protein SUPPRESSOR OF QUENCHING 1, chloroplastic-like [Solanum lycopersicum]|uniref:protein SUPPRESSOR OF QUENCHING 1, chloroplastic-like n=1 Tax=Solanum lycopersicum TaxID=4081 RepID=UPI003749038F
MVNAFQKLEERMYGVLCNSEKSSTKAAVDAFAGMGVQVTVEDFVPFMGMGFDAEAAKKRFFEIYLLKAIICSMQTELWHRCPWCL